MTIITYLVALLHHEPSLSAYGFMDNFLGIWFGIGLGMGDVVKANIGNLIGERKIVEAKNSANFYKFISIIFGFCLSLLVLGLSRYLAHFSSDVEVVYDILVILLMISSVQCVSGMLIGTQCSLMRMYGKSGV